MGGERRLLSYENTAASSSLRLFAYRSGCFTILDTFRVSAEGNINILEQRFKVGKRLKFQYVKATLYTQRQTLKVYYKGRLIKQFDYKLPRE